MTGTIQGPRKITRSLLATSGQPPARGSRELRARVLGSPLIPGWNRRPYSDFELVLCERQREKATQLPVYLHRLIPGNFLHWGRRTEWYFFFKLVLAQALKKEGRSEPPWVRLSRMDTKSVAVSGRHGADTETGLCGLYTQERPAFLGTCE